MPKQTKMKTVRRSMRKNPTVREVRLMQFGLSDIAMMNSDAIDVQENVYHFIAKPWDSHKIDFDPASLAFTFEQAVPTLLLMKLSAAVEDTLDKLWSIRFPEVDTRRLRHEDKLAVMERLHGVDGTPIRDLWKLRNECAHTVKKLAHRNDFHRYFEKVHQFVETFKKIPSARR